MSSIPTPHTIMHIHRYIDDTVTDPDTGNSPLIILAPVARKIVSITQVGKHGSSHMVMDEGFEQRVESNLRITTLEPDRYVSDDQVIVSPEFDPDGEYVDGSGTAYWVDGTPTDSRIGPWPRLLKQFGGVVHIRKVT